LLLELEGAAEEGDVVIGGKEGDQAEGEAAEYLQDAEAIEAQPALGWCFRFWRVWLLRGAVGRWLVGGRGWRHSIREGGDGGRGSAGRLPMEGMPPPVTPSAAAGIGAQTADPPRPEFLAKPGRWERGSCLQCPARLAGVADPSRRGRIGGGLGC
jgi:hypothetical protein